MKANEQVFLRKIQRMLESDAADKESIIKELDALKDNIKRQMRGDDVKQADAVLNVDLLFDDDDVLGADDTVVLRRIHECDFDIFKDLIYETTYIPKENVEEFIAETWRDYYRPMRAYAAIFNHQREFIGYCGIKNIYTEVPEIAIEILERHQCSGYGSHAVKVFVDNVKEKCGVDTYRIRTDADNYISQALFERMGAVPDGISDFFLLSDEEKEEEEKENAHLLDEKICAVAKKFGVKPELLLSHVLEYRLVV